MRLADQFKVCVSGKARESKKCNLIDSHYARRLVSIWRLEQGQVAAAVAAAALSPIDTVKVDRNVRLYLERAGLRYKQARCSDIVHQKAILSTTP